MKGLLIALMIVQLLLIVLLVAPFLRESQSYREAREAVEAEEAEQAEEAWERERAERDVQVLVAFGAMVGLCVNAFAICHVFGRLVADQPPRRSQRGSLSPGRRLRMRLAQIGVLVGIGLIAFGSIAFAQSLNNPSKAGLRGLVAILLGGLLAFIAGLAWIISAMPDEAPPVDAGPEADETVGPR